MKRIGIIAMAMALALGLTQCKKEQNAPTNDNETVAITLDIRNGGTRMDVNTVTGEVNYEIDDVIYVVSSGKYVGTLTHNGTNFSGPITNPTVGEPLHFYFLGNVIPAETLTAGTTESCSVVISDQTEHLPVIEYAPSDENYTAGATAFTAFLLNKCALVKFNVTTSSEAATCVMGFNNKVTIDFTDASFTYSQTNGGNITLPSGSGEKWAILLPQEAMEAGEAGSAYSQDGTYTGTCGAVPAIYDNGFLTAGIAVTITGEVPIGAISGKFTINANGDQVYFSQGNLQYQASTNTWRFATNQWDYVGGTDNHGYFYGNVSGSTNNNISATYSGWIDLFGWGTSGYNHGAVCYQPWSTSTNYSDYYAYGSSTCNLYDQTGKADWGYNAISNGGNTEGQWRTLTRDEWFYVFYSRPTLSGIRYAKATVNYVEGVILLPDDWSSSTYSLSNTNSYTASFSSNYIFSQWTTLESAGAVFLPITGFRFLPSILYIDRVDPRGYYWSASYLDSNFAHLVYFYDSYLHAASNGNRCCGYSVRLVRDYNP